MSKKSKTNKEVLINLGTRNKGTFWEYLAAYSFLKAKFPGSKFSFSFFAGIGRGISNQHCHSQRDIDRGIKTFIAEFEQGLYDNDYFKKLIKDYLRGLEDAKKIKKIDPKKLSNKNLAKLFDRSWKGASLPNPAMLQALYNIYLNDFFQEKLKAVLKEKEKNDPALINNIQSLLMTKKGLSATAKEEQALYEIKKEYWKKKGGIEKFLNDPATEKKIAKVAKDFGWFHMEYSADPFLPEDYRSYLAQALTAGKKELSPREREEEIQNIKKVFFVRHPDSGYLRKLVKVLEKFAFVLEDTKAAVVESFFLCLPVFEEAAARLGLGYKDMLYLAPPEISSLLLAGKKAGKKIIEKRKSGRLVVLKNKKITWADGKAVADFEKKYLPQNKTEEAREIKGITAYPGKVTGKVVLVRSIADHKRFKRGDIMVTHDGSAELTIMLKEAGAIVTNEGGIICHAATVAREFKTPSIVGTKVATKFIKDGDMVEVDADNGIVKVIK